jgi:hypothetical protein
VDRYSRRAAQPAGAPFRAWLRCRPRAALSGGVESGGGASGTGTPRMDRMRIVTIGTSGVPVSRFDASTPATPSRWAG